MTLWELSHILTIVAVPVGGTVAVGILYLIDKYLD